MVSTQVIQSSNNRIKSILPAGLVAVFIGSTNGVGETTVKQFAKHAAQPRVYIIGRSQEAGNRITEECKAFSPGGTFIFVKRETSLMRNVDEICNELAGKETAINLLFLSVGTLQMGMKTDEGLDYAAALTVYGRNRFISNLLPLIRQDQHGRLSRWKPRQDSEDGQVASITTLALEAHHKAAPEVSFVHNFPGAVESGIARGSIGWLMRTLKTVYAVLGPLVHIPLEEAGDRHLFFCTSERFSAGPRDMSAGVPLVEGLDLAKGTDGQIGSGVYSIDATGESAGPKVEKLLAQLRSQDMVERIRERIVSDIDGALNSLA